MTTRTITLPPNIDPAKFTAWISPVPEVPMILVAGPASHWLAEHHNPLGVPGDEIQLQTVNQNGYPYFEVICTKRNAGVEVKQGKDFAPHERLLATAIYPVGTAYLSDNDWYFISRLEAI